MIRGRRPFSGGYRFSRFQGQPAASLVALDAPRRVIIPLRQGFRDAAKSLVGPGDAVAAGQVVGADEARLCSPVHASVAGVVEEVRASDAGDAGGTIVIRTAPSGPLKKLPGHSPRWADLSGEAIGDLLYRAGVAALGGGIPTRHRSALIEPGEVEAILVRDTGSEMYCPSLSVVLGEERLRAFVEGLLILQKALRGAPVHVAIDRRESVLVGRLSRALSGRAGVALHPLEPRYPQDFDAVLVPALLGRPFPHGYAAANIGVVTLDCQAVVHAYEAVAEGKPLIERIVALCGPGCRRPVHARVPVGAPLADAARLAGAGEGVRFVKNSTLTGPKLADPQVPIDRTFAAVVALPERGPAGLLPFARPGFREDAHSRTFLSCLLPTARAASASLKGEPRPCVSCGYCQDVCPAGIIPHLLYKYVAKGYFEDLLATELRIFDCIGCNLCSYVCPSKIGVAEHVRIGQDRLLKEGVDNSADILSSFVLKGLDSSRPSAA
ncbi:MAG: 4Fe-4S dicluster domain-containing protein [Lentisphaerae bacterium]|nr:4Fe-4S dicluster domain-containing protein [Lentisphaerota bacterium]